jgi:hypothetical protein
MTAFEHDGHQLGILESFRTGRFLLLSGAPQERPLSLVSGSRGKIDANTAGTQSTGKNPGQAASPSHFDEHGKSRGPIRFRVVPA